MEGGVTRQEGEVKMSAASNTPKGLFGVRREHLFVGRRSA